MRLRLSGLPSFVLGLSVNWLINGLTIWLIADSWFWPFCFDIDRNSGLCWAYRSIEYSIEYRLTPGLRLCWLIGCLLWYLLILLSNSLIITCLVVLWVHRLPDCLSFLSITFSAWTWFDLSISLAGSFVRFICWLTDGWIDWLIYWRTIHTLIV